MRTKTVSKLEDPALEAIIASAETNPPKTPSAELIYNLALAERERRTNEAPVAEQPEIEQSQSTNLSENPSETTPEIGSPVGVTQEQVAATEPVDPVIAARSGDKNAQDRLAALGVEWNESPTKYRMIGEEELASVLSGAPVSSSRSTHSDTGVTDVTDNPDYGNVPASSKYRVTYKTSPDFDSQLGTTLRLKNKKAGEYHLTRPYDLNDIATIEERQEDGRWKVIHPSDTATTLPSKTTQQQSPSTPLPASAPREDAQTSKPVDDQLRPLRAGILKYKGEGKTKTGSKVFYDATERLKAITGGAAGTSLAAQHLWFNSKRKILAKNGDAEAAALFEQVVVHLRERIKTANKPVPVKINDAVKTAEVVESKPQPESAPADADIGIKLQDKIDQSYEDAVKEYNALDNKELGITSNNGNILDTDLARELSPEYRNNRSKSSQVHDAASAFIKRIYADKLSKPTPQDKSPIVLFTAGGTGAGKSASLRMPGIRPLVENAEIVYDTSMSKLESSISKIDQALNAGRDVRIVYTYRDVADSFVNGSLPRAELMGRTVEIGAHIKTHVGASEVIRKLSSLYAGNPRVVFHYVDNSHGKGGERKVSLTNLPHANDNNLKEKLHGHLTEEHKNGKISDATLRGTADSRNAEEDRRVRQGPDSIPKPKQPQDLNAEVSKFVRRGDFWNYSGDRVAEIAKALDLTVTSRNGAKLVGIPDHLRAKMEQQLREAGINAEFEKPTDEVSKAKEHLDAAGIQGKERLDTIGAVKRGEVTAEDVAEAHAQAINDVHKKDENINTSEERVKKSDISNTQDGDVRLSLVGSTKDRRISFADASAIVDRIALIAKKDWNLDVVLVASHDALPEKVKAAIAKDYGKDTKAKGVVHNGIAYIVADEHTSQADVEETILHEIKGHVGVHRLYGKDIRQKLNELYLAIGGNKGLSAIARKRGINADLSVYSHLLSDSKMTDDQRVQVMMDEALAHIAQNPKFSDRVKAIVGLIRAWLRDNGFAKLAEYGETDLLHILDQANNALKTKTGDAGGTMLMVAWHGSPHDHDGFSMDKVGTGEGAQAYGHGLYFAGSKEVAEWYRNNLSSPTDVISDGAIKELEASVKFLPKKLRKEAGDVIKRLGTNSHLYSIKNDVNKYGSSEIYEWLTKITDRKGRLYQVELAPSEDEYLLWDKPLSEQSEKVRAALSKYNLEYPISDTTKGEDIYINVALDTSRGLENSGYKAASDYLHSLGIRGIKYLDGSSRSIQYEVVLSTSKGEYARKQFDKKQAAEAYAEEKRGEGFSAKVQDNENANSNYVIFNDEDVSITAKFSRRIHGDKMSASDYVVPETPEFDGNMNGDLAYTPQSAEKKGIEQLPIRLPVGIAREAHRGYGISHIKAEGDAIKSRRPPGYTDDEAENYSRHVATIAKSFSEIYKDGNNLILRSARMKEALVVSEQTDRETGERFYSVVSLRPAEKLVWGAPEWLTGRASLPGDRLLQPRASDPSPDHDSQQSDRLVQRNQTSKYIFAQNDDDRQPKNKTVVTHKKRRAYTMGEIKESQSSAIGGQTVESITKATAKLRASWLGFKQIKIIQSVKEIPNELYLRALRAGAAIDQGTEGIYDPKTNTVYLIADNIASPERAVWVAIHEVVGHGGIRMLNAPVANTLNFAAKNGFVTKLAKQIAADRGETFDARTHTDEAIAELAAATITGNVDAILERYGVKVPMAMRSNLLGMIKRVVDAIRNFVGRVTGKPVEEVSDGEVLGLILRMKEAAEGKAQEYDTAGVSDGALASLQSTKDAFISALGRWFSMPEKFRASGLPIIVGETPLVLKQVGAEPHPISIDRGTLIKVTRAHGELPKGHGITKEQLEQLPDALANPLAIFESAPINGVRRKDGRVVLTTMRDGQKERVVVAIHLSKSAGRSHTINDISSVHGRSDAEIKRWVDSGLTLYFDDTQNGISPEWLTTGRLKLPAVVQAAQSLGNNVRLKSEIVQDSDQPLSSRAPSQQSIPGTAQPPAKPPRQGNIPLQGGQTGNNASWDSPEPSMLDDIAYKLQDKNIDLKRVLQAIKSTGAQVANDFNTYLQEELFHGRAAKRTQDFVNTELRPMMVEMKTRGIKLEEIDAYLHARHAKEANALIAQRDPNMADGGSGMTNQQADDYFANLPQLKQQQLGATAKRVDAIIAKTREYYVSYNLVSRNQANEWAAMFKHYVPLMREDHDGGMGIGQGFSIKGKEVKHRTGSTAAVVDIFANIALQREKAIVRGEKNRVATSLFGLAYLNPNQDFWTAGTIPTERVLNEKTGLVEVRIDPMFKSRNSVVVAKIKDKSGNIQERAVVFNERNERAIRMAEALKNLDATQLGGLLGVSAVITRYFSSINTQYNPIFGVTNLVRDVGGMTLNLSSTPIETYHRSICKISQRQKNQHGAGYLRRNSRIFSVDHAPDDEAGRHSSGKRKDKKAWSDWH
ncbi:MuF-C-terminal domain-containing protein [Candidatus Nitrotoga sp. AM1P]|uniref:MuF-C-terminal domain-containing protein n=1 Tax=Candidatus Nitrotoga sp. AM1P TaxID=2559597 RepID=UPI0010B8C0B5|nr:hypothetical protein [Candidatus Nitrotoga sp. AM1P]BBJ23271.1 hypothetical protein W01_11980 [Candidatus Nitrotoga sp. AM1P]